MTTVTGQLQATAAADMATARDAANAETIRQNAPVVMRLQQERIAELEAELFELRTAYGERYDQVESLAREVRVLREVARAVNNVGPVNTNMGNWQPLWDAMDTARAAGYLAEEARP